MTQREDPAQAQLARFLEEQERGEAGELDAWLDAREELDPALRERVRALRDVWSRAASVLAERRARGRGRTRFFAGAGADRPDEPDPGEVRVSAGETIADFRLLRRIGRGGMGQVWEAEQESLRRRVALKLVLPERVDAASLELFAREARAGGRLHDPHIVETHAFGSDRGLAWIAQELVEGSWTLKDFLDEMRAAGELPADYYRSVAELLAKVADGLEAAHRAGVIHRDVKPQNILVGPDDEPKLTDFGLARITDEASLSRTGDLAGTYYYMSPEQVAAKRMGIDHRTDVFSLGVVLYEMLTLRLPFEGDTTHQICAKIVTWDPPDPRRVRSQCPAELAVICTKALEKNPDERFATMAELAADLKRHLANEPILARPPGRLSRARKWVQRNPYKALAAGLASGAFVAVSALTWALQGRTTDLRAANVELAEEKHAVERAREEADHQAEIARKNELLEQQRAADVFSLSAFQKLADLEKLADELWPPHPEHLGAYDAWIADAADLVAGLDPDPNTDDIGHRARLAALRERALPFTQEDREAARRAHPRFGEIAPLKDRIAALSAAQEVREGEARVSEPELDPATLPGDAEGLLQLADPLVDPERTHFGEEARGLALARLALERVEDDTAFAKAQATLAWALLATGQDDEAIEEMALAVELAPEELRAGSRRAQSRLRDAVDAVAGARGVERVAALERELELLEAEASARWEWRFENEEDRWWHNQLTLLVAEIEAFADPETGPWMGISNEHGWGIERRRGFAIEVEERTVSGAKVAREWSTAAERVAANPKYAAVTLTPQLGLVPLGPDPESGLEEFGHPLTGSVPQRDDEGRLVIEEDAGLVFVLLPGGPFWMGAQNLNPNGRNYDLQTLNGEAPVHEVDLSAFFLSKYEMTQGQWASFTGRNPSRDRRETYPRHWNKEGRAGSLLHPVEQVSWWTCVEICERLGLSLPSEAQWEYGARSGTTSVWWTGDDRESLAGAANLADRYARDHGAAGWTIENWLDDGNTIHAPVDAYAPNAFGLHNVHGNVWEWCRDGYDVGFYRRSSTRDPINEPSGSSMRVNRGGSFNASAAFARSAYRYVDSPESTAPDLGLRPARVLRAP